tara:strand:- start:2171 stop:2479 length:309 start_codon:yes stop_codon:yes gene_type:complete
MSIQFEDEDPARIASSVLGGVGMLGGSARGAARGLGAAAKTLLGVDLETQEIPFLGEITDGLTVAAGVGSLIASAFENKGGDDGDDAPVEGPAPSVGASYGA